MGADLKKLQNGSDIRGVALEGVKGEAVNLGIEEAAALTAGFQGIFCGKQLSRLLFLQESMSLTAAWHLHRQCSCLRYFPNTPVTEQ